MVFIYDDMILKFEVFNMPLNYDLPNQLNDILNETIQKSSDAFPELIKQSGYVPPSPVLLYDAIAALSMGKNILLKGPTGTGKTKFAETLSHLFNQPMFSINSSVDLDAES